MSLPSIGAHCALPSCHVNDFLPIRCRCDALFCRDHIAAEAHACPLLESHTVTQPEDGSNETEKDKWLRCAADKCTKPSLEAFIAKPSGTQTEDHGQRTRALCTRCGLAFCATHRDPIAHACSGPDPVIVAEEAKKQRNVAAHVLLAKHFPPPAQSSRTTTGSVPERRKAGTSLDPKKAAQLRKVEAMKMRHKAQPGDPKDVGRHVGIEEKLHFRIRLEAQEDAQEKILWFRKAMIAGKALDLLADIFRISSNTTSLKLLKHDSAASELIELENSESLAAQVEDGSTLLIRRVTNTDAPSGS